MKKRFLRSNICAVAMMSATFLLSNGAGAAEVLDYVPAETPMYMGSTAGLPMLEFAASTQEYQIYLSEMFKELDALTQISDEDELNGLKFLTAIIKSNMDFSARPAAFIEEYGYANPLVFATYMSGATPVFRYKLADPTKFADGLARWSTDNKLVVEKLELGGTYFNRYMLMGPSETSLHFLAAVIAVQGDTAVMTFDFGDNDMLSRALGVEMPELSLADSGIVDQMNLEWNYGNEFSGFVDIKSLMNQFLPSEGQIHKDLTRILPRTFTSLMPEGYEDPGCMNDVDAMTDIFPRIVTGFRATDRSANAITSDSHMAIHIRHPELMAALMQLRGHVSKDIVNENSIFGMAMGFDTTQWMPVMNSIIEIINNATPQCDHMVATQQSWLQGLRVMMAGGGAMNGMAPGFKGFSMAIYGDGMTEDGPDIATIDLLGAITGDNPGALLQAAQMILPMNNLTLPSNGTAINLRDTIDDPSILPIDLFASQTDKHLLFFNGPTAEQIVTNFDGSNIEKNGLMYMYVNVRSYFNMLFNFEAIINGGDARTSDDLAEMADMLMMIESIPDAVGDLLIDFTPNGLEFTARSTYYESHLNPTGR